jgi:membrane-associated phospholipid phosphatase
VGLRVSVAIGLVFFTGVVLVSLAQARRAGRDPRSATAIGWRRPAGIALGLIACGVALQWAAGAHWARVALDWLPGIYLLAGYWLPAQLARRAAPRLQARLHDTDQVLFRAGLAGFLQRAPRLVLEYLEAAYLCCYLVVPLSLAWVYFQGGEGEADRFWTAVLLAALPCYALVVPFETLPPREVESVAAAPLAGLAMRRLNLAVLGRASNGLNTFPSGHAAASFAAALSVGAVVPPAGGLLGVLALSIAVGSVAGRYHYALDSACGALVAILAFGLSRLV